MFKENMGIINITIFNKFAKEEYLMNAFMIKEMKNYLQFNREHNINDICAPLYSLGLKGFFYVKLYPDGTFVDLATNLNSAEFYLNKFYSCEYSLSDMQHNYLPNGINLWEMNKSNQIWADCRDIFNIGNGFSISLPSNSTYTEMFFYYSSAIDYKINELYLNHLDIFKNFALYFKEKTEKLIKKAEQYKITMPEYYKELYLPKNNASTNLTKIKDYYTLLDIKKFYFDDKQYLTYKEGECLNWYARGMTIKAIAKILNSSSKTIESHIDNLKQKLGCFNKAGLTSIAISLGIFNYFKNKENYYKS